MDVDLRGAGAFFLGLCSLLAAAQGAAPPEFLVSSGAVWKYLDDGSDPGTAWRELRFDDTAWAQGPAELGYGDEDIKTAVRFGADAENKFITTYFRHVFDVPDPAKYRRYRHLTLGTVCDDGCAVYLNGREVWRTNLPHGPLDHRTQALKGIDEQKETVFQPDRIDPVLLRQGRNLIAVEVHQQRPYSSDLGFNFYLAGSDAAPAVATLAAGAAQRKPGSPEDLIATSADAVKVRRALERLRSQATQSLLRHIQQRVAADRALGNTQNLGALAELEESYALLAYESAPAVPGFLWKEPASFAVKTANENLRFLAFGDFGQGTVEQKQVATTMQAEHRQRSFDFGITLGDNYYPSGMLSPQDERWQSQWEALYTPLGVKFYASLGNHDWDHPDSAAAEILYSAQSPSWQLPTAYYSYVAGIAEFFVLNTEVLTERQLLWLEDKLKHSTAPWKIVYGHHPIYAGSRDDNQDLITRLLPVLRGKADVYLAGHDHVLAHLKPEDDMEFFISGGGGASNYKIRQDNPRLLFGQSAYGFLAVEVTPQALRFRFVGADGRELYTYTAHKS